MLLFDHHQKLFTIIPLDERIGHPVAEILQQTVDRTQYPGFFTFLCLLHQFIVVIQYDQHDRRTGLPVQHRIPLHLGDINKVQQIKVFPMMFPIVCMSILSIHRNS